MFLNTTNEACVAGVAAPAQLQGKTLRTSRYGSYSELEDYFQHPTEETDNSSENLSEHKIQPLTEEQMKFLIEETIIPHDKLPKYIYHASDKNHEGEIFKPRKPFGEKEKDTVWERNFPRVCFADNINGCLNGVYGGLKNIGLYMYIHVPYNSEKLAFYYSTSKDVWDGEANKEIWCLSNVKMRCIGRIYIYDIKKSHQYVNITDKVEDASEMSYIFNIFKWKWVDIFYPKEKNLYEDYLNFKFPINIPDGNRIIDLFFRMKDRFKYGFIKDGKCINSKNSSVWNKNYKTISPKDFERYFCGNCWDCVAYEVYYFKKVLPNIPFRTYFLIIQDGNKTQTHTWLSYKFKGKIRTFEIAMLNHQVADEFWDSESDMFKFYKKELCKTLNTKLNKVHYYLCEFTQMDTYGLTISEYINYMSENGYEIEGK